MGYCFPLKEYWNSMNSIADHMGNLDNFVISILTFFAALKVKDFEKAWKGPPPLELNFCNVPQNSRVVCWGFLVLLHTFVFLALFPMGLLTFPVFKDGPLPMGMQKDLKVSKASLYCFIDAHVVFVVVLRISGALFALTLDTNICRQNIEKTTQGPQVLWCQCSSTTRYNHYHGKIGAPAEALMLKEKVIFLVTWIAQ